jgi:hypothetical protein
MNCSLIPLRLLPNKTKTMAKKPRVKKEILWNQSVTFTSTY